MRTFSFSRLFALAALVTLASGTLNAALPGEPSWDNPSFAKSFTGSYGFMTDREPEITRNESALFETIIPLMQSDPAAAAAKISQSLSAESSAAVHYTLGNLYLQLSQVEPAMRQYQLALEKFPSFLRANKNMGLAHMQKGNYKEALKYFIISIELGAQDSDLFGLLGYCYLNTEKYDSSLEAYSYALMLDPYNKDWREGRAFALQAAGQYDQVLVLMKELLAEDPERKEYYIAAVNALIALSRPQEAATYLEILDRMGLADAPSLVLAGDIYIQQGLSKIALERYQKALTADRSISLTRALRIGTSMLDQGYASDAMEFLESVSETYPDSSESYDLIKLDARIALYLGDTKRTVELLEKVLEEKPLDGESLMTIGDVYSQSESTFQEAIYYYQRASKIDSVAADALVKNAQLQVSLKEYDEAIKLLKEAQVIRPRTYVQDYLDSLVRIQSRI